VLIDGTALLDDNDEPLQIDGYSETVRYEVKTTIQADSEGEHFLTLVNSGARNPESSGNGMSIYQVEVLPPLRPSSLPAIIGVLLATQLVGALFAFTIGRPLCRPLANYLDTKRSIMLALTAYAIISVWGFFLNSVIEFWFLAWLVAIVQGGSQALSRSLYAAMSPKAMSGEFFGFFSIMSKLASFLSPIVFIVAIEIYNSSRPGVLSLIVFFAVGMLILSRVDVEAGKAYANQKDAEIAAATAAAD
jgi:MFS family permease